MTGIGKVESLWRYPVKSMRGEDLEEVFVGFFGVYGDRRFAFKSSASPKGFPFLTGREQEGILRYRPRFRDSAKAAKPINLAEAEGIAPGVTALFADPDDLAVDVETPSGQVLAVDDPVLVSLLAEGLKQAPTLTVLQSDRAMTDCRPVSMFAVQTAQQLGEEIGIEIDKRRFRANIYVNLESGRGFGEDDLVGQNLRIGSKAVVSILERDPRCKMISLDPETGAQNPDVLRKVSRAHDGKAGVYAAVLVEGLVRRGDAIELVT